MSSLLAEARDDVLYLSGTVANQGQCYDRFDAVVLLTALIDVGASDQNMVTRAVRG
jgi:hypothetical protein